MMNMHKLKSFIAFYNLNSLKSHKVNILLIILVSSLIPLLVIQTVREYSKISYFYKARYKRCLVLDKSVRTINESSSTREGFRNVA